MLFIKIFSTTVITLIISLKALFSQMNALNYEISSLVRPNWEYESFWAIPRIGETKPIVAISLLAGKDKVNVWNCSSSITIITKSNENNHRYKKWFKQRNLQIHAQMLLLCIIKFFQSVMTFSFLQMNFLYIC